MLNVAQNFVAANIDIGACPDQRLRIALLYMAVGWFANERVEERKLLRNEIEAL